jgi:hypothetical protein
LSQLFRNNWDNCSALGKFFPAARLTFLARLFETPLGVSEQDFGRQFLMLEQ